MGSISERQIRRDELPRGVVPKRQVLGLSAISQILEIERASFPNPWTERDYTYFLTHECGFNFGLLSSGENSQLQAYLIGLLVRGDLDIVSLATRPQFRRIGLAENLIDFSCSQPEVRRVFLEVDVANEGAVQLYRKKGFKILGVRRKYYESKRDAYSMALIL